jgi:hypothetical protein
MATGLAPQSCTSSTASGADHGRVPPRRPAPGARAAPGGQGRPHLVRLLRGRPRPASRRLPGRGRPLQRAPGGFRQGHAANPDGSWTRVLAAAHATRLVDMALAQRPSGLRKHPAPALPAGGYTAGSVAALFSFAPDHVPGRPAVQPSGSMVFSDRELPATQLHQLTCGARHQHLARGARPTGRLFGGACDGPDRLADSARPRRQGGGAELDRGRLRAAPVASPTPSHPQPVSTCWPGCVGRATWSSTRSPGRAAPGRQRRTSGSACAGRAATSTRSMPSPGQGRASGSRLTGSIPARPGPGPARNGRYEPEEAA